MKLRIKRFDASLSLPIAEVGAAGFDIPCREDAIIPPHSVKQVAVNIAIDVPEGYFILLASRSSTPLLKGLMLADGIGVVDPYSEDDHELQVQLLNFTSEPVAIKKGELLTQGMLIKNEPITWQEVSGFDKPYDSTPSE